MIIRKRKKKKRKSFTHTCWFCTATVVFMPVLQPSQQFISTALLTLLPDQILQTLGSVLIHPQQAAAFILFRRGHAFSCSKFQRLSDLDWRALTGSSRRSRGWRGRQRRFPCCGTALGCGTFLGRDLAPRRGSFAFRLRGPWFTAFTLKGEKI